VEGGPQRKVPQGKGVPYFEGGPDFGRDLLSRREGMGSKNVIVFLS
jgi:hypothetical protein